MTHEMAIEPQAYGIEPRFIHWHGDPAEDRIGPFFYCTTGGEVETALRLEKHHLSAYGSAHGGILMALADYTLCLTAIGDSGLSCVTVSFNSEFVSSATDGELVLGRGELAGGGRKLKFTRAQFFVGERLVLNASASIKLIGR